LTSESGGGAKKEKIGGRQKADSRGGARGVGGEKRKGGEPDSTLRG